MKVRKYLTDSNNRSASTLDKINCILERFHWMATSKGSAKKRLFVTRFYIELLIGIFCSKQSYNHGTKESPLCPRLKISTRVIFYESVGLSNWPYEAATRQIFCVVTSSSVWSSGSLSVLVSVSLSVLSSVLLSVLLSVLSSVSLSVLVSVLSSVSASEQRNLVTWQQERLTLGGWPEEPHRHRTGLHNLVFPDGHGQKILRTAQSETAPLCWTNSYRLMPYTNTPRQEVISIVQLVPVSTFIAIPTLSNREKCWIRFGTKACPL